MEPVGETDLREFGMGLAPIAAAEELVTVATCYLGLYSLAALRYHFMCSFQQDLVHSFPEITSSKE